jgi:hypothetical protein
MAVKCKFYLNDGSMGCRIRTPKVRREKYTGKILKKTYPTCKIVTGIQPPCIMAVKEAPDENSNENPDT